MLRILLLCLVLRVFSQEQLKMHQIGSFVVESVKCNSVLYFLTNEKRLFLWEKDQVEEIQTSSEILKMQQNKETVVFIGEKGINMVTCDCSVLKQVDSGREITRVEFEGEQAIYSVEGSSVVFQTEDCFENVKNLAPEGSVVGFSGGSPVWTVKSPKLGNTTRIKLSNSSVTVNKVFKAGNTIFGVEISSFIDLAFKMWVIRGGKAKLISFPVKNLTTFSIDFLEIDGVCLLKLLNKVKNFTSIFAFDYHLGLFYPFLERVEGQIDKIQYNNPVFAVSSKETVNVSTDGGVKWKEINNIKQFSSETVASGILLALATNNILLISHDYGQNFSEIQVSVNSYCTAMSLLVAIKDNTRLTYSHNWGEEWTEIPLNSQIKSISGLKCASEHILLEGKVLSDSKISSIALTFPLSSLFSSECESTQIEAKTSICLNGSQKTVKYRKKGAFCVLPKEKEIQMECQCERQDFICDSGFVPKDEECVFKEKVESDCEDYKIASRGYRKTLFNNCSGKSKFDRKLVECSVFWFLFKWIALFVVLLVGLAVFLTMRMRSFRREQEKRLLNYKFSKVD